MPSRPFTSTFLSMATYRPAQGGADIGMGRPGCAQRPRRSRSAPTSCDAAGDAQVDQHAGAPVLLEARSQSLHVKHGRHRLLEPRRAWAAAPCGSLPVRRGSWVWRAVASSIVRAIMASALVWRLMESGRDWFRARVRACPARRPLCPPPCLRQPRSKLAAETVPGAHAPHSAVASRRTAAPLPSCCCGTRSQTIPGPLEAPCIASDGLSGRSRPRAAASPPSSSLPPPRDRPRS